MWIYPEQLFIKLQKELKPVYVLLGNDSYLLQDSHIGIIKMAKLFNFNENINLELDTYSNWEDIFNLFKVSNLFEKQKILSLKFLQNYPITCFKKKAHLLSALLRDDVVLILYVYTLNQINKNNIWLQCFHKRGVFVDCTTPTYTRLIAWIKSKAKNMKLIIENLACQLLCYYYEGNLTLLNQVLQNLSLIYPDGNLSFIRVKKMVTDSACFNVNHWIEAILIGNKRRADRILGILECIGVDLEVLLCKIRYEILILTNIKHSIVMHQKSFFHLSQQYKIHSKYNYMLLFKAIKRLELYQLYKSVELLTQLELEYKRDYVCLSKSNFELLSTILCCTQKIS